MIKICSITLFVFCLFSCSKKQISAPYPEPAHTKKASFSIYQAADYSSTVYDSTYAEVTLGIYKQSTTDTSTTTLWDTVLVRQRLRTFPLPAQPLVIVKTIPNVYDSKQRVRTYTIVKYDNRGTNQVGGSNIPFTTGVDSLQVNVTL